MDGKAFLVVSIDQDDDCMEPGLYCTVLQQCDYESAARFEQIHAQARLSREVNHVDVAVFPTEVIGNHTGFRYKL